MMRFRSQILERSINLRDPQGTLEVVHIRGGHLDNESGLCQMGLEVESAKLGHRYYEDCDLFRCLAKFRQEIEPSGWIVICNAARLNAWQSGMSSSMSGGTKVYLLCPKEEGKPTLVDSFAEAPLSDVATFDLQRAWVQNFYKQSDMQRNG